jgi:hypothetical protein
VIPIQAMAGAKADLIASGTMVCPVVAVVEAMTLTRLPSR